MARSTKEYLHFNRGLISPLALARTDVERVGLSAETFINYMPRRLGSMMMRPGTGYIGATASNNKAKYIPFVFASDDKALIELTATTMRVWVGDALISRPSVGTAITKGDFSSPQTGWVDNSESGGSIAYTTVGGLDVVRLIGDGTGAGIVTQDITVFGPDQSVEHGLLVEVGKLDPTATGYISGVKPTIKAGSGAWSATSTDDLISEVQLDTGQHHFSFTPTGDFWVELSNRQDGRAYVRTCDMDASGTLSITALWAEANLSNIRWEQSGDVLYVSCKDVPPIKISRYTSNSKSWGVGLYEPEDGPFNDINLTPVTIAPNALSGGVNLVASAPFWKTTDVGRLVRIDSDGQTVTSSISAQNTFTSAIKVTGVTNGRVFTYTTSGRTDSTITLQRSLTASDSGFVDVVSITTNATVSYDDTLDNQIAWYRIGIKTGDYGTDTVACTLDYPNGSITGFARIYFYSSVTVAQAEVLKDFGSTSAQSNWYLGSWSTRSGFPTAVALTEGRLGWAGQNKIRLTVSDAYESFDDSVVGDSGPITRTIGSGPVDSVNWMLELERLIFGTDSAAHALRSTRDEEILTPSNAKPKRFSTQGSAKIVAVKIDDNAVFAQTGGTRLMEIAQGAAFKYETHDLTTLYPEAGDSLFTHIAVQRQPDTRIHCLRTDGTVMILVYDSAEEVTCWVKFFNGAVVEDIVILPGGSGDGEDAVYYAVKRTVDSATVRYLEKWSLESESQGSTTNKQVDAHITGTVLAGVLTGLTHLEGEVVAVWSNGKDVGLYTVSSGQITGVTEEGSAVAGLSYAAQWKSTKLGHLTRKKNVSQLGVVLKNTHYQGLKYGRDFNNLDLLPQVKDGAIIADDTIHATFDEESFAFDGSWDSDSRLCLQSASPLPCTILAIIADLEES